MIRLNRIVAKLEKTAVKRAVAKVIDKEMHYGIAGQSVTRLFEDMLSETLGRLAVLGVNSGTDALIFTLKALGIGPGDEVIVPAFSFISTASAVAWIGAKPVFADIRLDDYAIDPRQIEDRISGKTRGIIVAHLFGQPALRIGDIARIAKMHSIPLVEDAAQSFGAKIRLGDEWKTAGTIGDAGCFSFSSRKIFAAPGTGGAIVIKNKELYDPIDKMRFYGAQTHYYDYPALGVNAKLQEVHAAALIAKFAFADYWYRHRTNLAAVYRDCLAGISAITLPDQNASPERVWYRYVVRVDEKYRDALFETLSKKAGSRKYLRPMKNYPVPLPYLRVFSELGHKAGDFPESERASREVISLPIANIVTKDEAALVGRWIKEFFL